MNPLTGVTDAAVHASTTWSTEGRLNGNGRYALFQGAPPRSMAAVGSLQGRPADSADVSRRVAESANCRWRTRSALFTSATPLTPGTDTNEAPDAFVASLAADRDLDHDSLDDDWERVFDLDPAVAAGANGPLGDPDGDGATNLDELRAGTHPRGAHVRYFAEGAVNQFFDATVSLANPGTSPASVAVRFDREGEASAAVSFVLPARTIRTLDAWLAAGIGAGSFSTTLESDQPIVADRTMKWGHDGYGAHAETSVPAPATAWYLAEGATGGPFSLFYLLQNPGSSPVSADISYLFPRGLRPIVKTYMLAPFSRTTVWVDTEHDRLRDTDVSAIVRATGPIVVERAMYLDRANQVWAAGHASAGVTSPSTTWFLAEGATGSFFDLYILLANPNDQAAAVDVRFLTSTGTVVTKAYVLAAQSRTTILVDEEEFGAQGRVLASAEVSSTITSTNGVPIIAERTMWWPQGDWHEGTNVAGATEPGLRWAVAGCEELGPADAATFFHREHRGIAGARPCHAVWFRGGIGGPGRHHFTPRAVDPAIAPGVRPAVAGRERFEVRRLGRRP